MSKYEQLERKLIETVNNDQDLTDIIGEIETATATNQIDLIERSQLIDLLPLE